MLGTHGRGFYVLDNIEPLRQYTPAIASRTEPYLFAPATAIRLRDRRRVPVLAQAARAEPDDRDARCGREGGPDVHGRSASDTAQRAVARRSAVAVVEDGGGGGQAAASRPARRWAPVSTRRSWDLRYAPATTFPGMILWGATTNGPLAVPGTYQVRLTVDGKTLTRPVTIRKNPLYHRRDPGRSP